MNGVQARIAASALLFSLISGVRVAAQSPAPDPLNDNDRHFLSWWQDAIKRDDKSWIVSQSSPPVELSACVDDLQTLHGVGDEIDHKNWIADYDLAVSQRVKDAILEATSDDLVRGLDGITIYRPGIALWFEGPEEKKETSDFDGYRLVTVFDWRRESCGGVILDPRKDDKSVPPILRGEWGIKGDCSKPKNRLVLTATTSRMGREKPRRIYFENHDGRDGRFQALEWWEEYDLGHFDLDPRTMDWLNLVAGWSSSPSYGYYQRCKKK